MVQATNLIDNDYKAQTTLPVGHVDRFKSKEALRNEYRCHAVESFWNKKRGWKHNKKSFRMSAVELLQFCNILCNEFGYRRLKRIVINSKEAKEKHCGGFYRHNEIHIASKYVKYSVLLHELAHHFQRVDSVWDGTHGKRFAIAVSMLNAVAHKLITGKEIKSDWTEKADKVIEDSYERKVIVNSNECF